MVKYKLCKSCPESKHCNSACNDAVNFESVERDPEMYLKEKYKAKGVQAYWYSNSKSSVNNQPLDFGK